MEENQETEVKKTKSYIRYVFYLITKPDSIITKDYKGHPKFGFMSMTLLVFLVFMDNLTRDINGGETNGAWYAVELHSSIILAIAYAIPLIIVLFLLNWIATEVINRESISYYLEKVGAVMVIHCILLTLSIILKLYGVIVYT